MSRHVRLLTAAASGFPGAFALLVALPGVALGHGQAPGEPDLSTLIGGWSFDVVIWLPIALAGWAWMAAVRSVDRAHPDSHVPMHRTWCWLAGLGVVVLALQSPIERYDTTLFSVHMVQHMLLMMVAAPLFVLAGPVTLLLRVASPGARKRWILPVLHSRVLRVVAFPVVAWLLFATVMFVSHFSPLFDAALEDPLIHLLEHALFLGSALLFWWPALGIDPAPWRMSHPARIGYMALGMPWSSFLGLAIFSASTVLYPHYATIKRDWGMPPLEDQQWAGGIMWAGGDLVFLIMLVLSVGTWLRAEEVEGRRIDAQLEREREAAEGASALDAVSAGARPRA
jgi:putative membrane protein